MAGGAPGHPVTAWDPETDRGLRSAADFLLDIERLRMATENRLRQYARPKDQPDKDGRRRGFGWSLSQSAITRDTAVALIDLKCDSLVLAEIGIEKAPRPRPPRDKEGQLPERGCCLEHAAERRLARELRTHPLGPWVKAQRGIGEKQGPRLIGAIGDPYMRPAYRLPDGTVEAPRPRTPYELFAYCGMHVVDGHAPKRARGNPSNWSADARTRAHLVAESCLKGLRKPCESIEGAGYAVHVEGCACFPYRLLYDQYREKIADRELTAGHKLNMALRRVAKEILLDLWREAKRIHESD